LRITKRTFILIELILKARNKRKLRKNTEREKNQIARENMANDLAVAKENAKGRAKKTK